MRGCSYYDNALAERFFQLLKRARIKCHVYTMRDKAAQKPLITSKCFTASSVSIVINSQLSPVECEMRCQERLKSF